jgi:hypothetical protein
MGLRSSAARGPPDREWARHLSHTLEDPPARGPIAEHRLSGVTTSARRPLGCRACTRSWPGPGEVQLTSVPPAVRGRSPSSDGGTFQWSRSSRRRAGRPPAVSCTPGPILRRVACTSCRPAPQRTPLSPAATPVADAGSLGRRTAMSWRFRGRARHRLGAIGELRKCIHGSGLIAVGCVAHFPSDGARMADYLVGGGGWPRVRCWPV